MRPTSSHWFISMTSCNWVDYDYKSFMIHKCSLPEDCILQQEYVTTITSSWLTSKLKNACIESSRLFSSSMNRMGIIYRDRQKKIINITSSSWQRQRRREVLLDTSFLETDIQYTAECIVTNVSCLPWNWTDRRPKLCTHLLHYECQHLGYIFENSFLTCK